MREKLTAWLSASIIVFMIKISRKAKLKPIEEKVQKEYIAHLGLAEKKNCARPGKIVGIVGLIGSGRTSVAKALAELVSALVIEADDDIRVLLRKVGASYDRTWKICENAAIAVAESGRDVIIDSDFIRAEKRTSLEKAAQRIGTNVFYVRTICHPEMVSYRMMKKHYREDSFFPGAKPTCSELAILWDTLTKDEKGELIERKERERRLLNHYRWQGGAHGGRFIERKLSFVDFTVYTTDEKKWPGEVKKIAKQIRLR